MSTQYDVRLGDGMINVRSHIEKVAAYLIEMLERFLRFWMLPGPKKFASRITNNKDIFLKVSFI